MGSFGGGITVKLFRGRSEGNGVLVTTSQDAIVVVHANSFELLENSQSPRMLSAFLFRHVTGVTPGHTKRGITVDITASSDRHATDLCLHLLCPDPPSREVLFQALHSSWRRVKFPSGHATLNTSQQSLVSEEPSEAVRNILHSVRAMQYKAASMLQDLRHATSELMAPEIEGDTDGVKSWAGLMLQRRQSMEFAQEELHRIQKRREKRAAQLRSTQWASASPPRDASDSDPHCRHCKLRVENVFEHERKCAYRPVTCRHCDQSMPARDFPMHRDYSCPANSGSPGAQLQPPLQREPTRSSLRSRQPSIALSEAPSESESEAPSPAHRRTPSIRSEPTLRSHRVSTPTFVPSGVENTGFTSPRIRQSSVAVSETASDTASVAAAPSPTQQSPLRGSVRSAAGTRGSLCPHCTKPCPADHPQRCAYRPVQCRRCGGRLQAKNFEEHRASCPAKASRPSQVTPAQPRSSAPTRYKFP